MSPEMPMRHRPRFHLREEELATTFNAPGQLTEIAFALRFGT